jgi:hypothetical protein
MFFLFIPVMRKNRLEVIIRTGVNALVVPVNRLQFESSLIGS